MGPRLGAAVRVSGRWGGRAGCRVGRGGNERAARGPGRLGAAGCAPRAVPGPAGAASGEAQLGKRGRSLCVRVRCRFVPPGEPAPPWLSPPGGALWWGRSGALIAVCGSEVCLGNAREALVVVVSACCRTARHRCGGAGLGELRAFVAVSRRWLLTAPETQVGVTWL